MHAQREGIHTTDTSRNNFNYPVLCPPCLPPYVYISQLFYLNTWFLTTIHTRTEVFNVIFSDQGAPNREFLHIIDTHVPLTIDPQDYAMRSVNHKCIEPRQTSRRKAMTWQVVQEPLGIAPCLGQVWNHENTRRWPPQLRESLSYVPCIQHKFFLQPEHATCMLINNFLVRSSSS